jgi:hypothetical protein
VVKKYVLELTAEERATLEQVVKGGKGPRWRVRRARALLQCDQGPHGPGWSDALVARACNCSLRSLEVWRHKAVQAGPLSLLQRKPRFPAAPVKLDDEGQARLLALAGSPPPPGHTRWTLRLLAKRLVELQVVESITHETVRRALTLAAGRPYGRRGVGSRRTVEALVREARK